MSDTGQGNISISRRTLPVGTFPAGAADNGLSVDLVTGHIVLGNDAAGIAATLLSNREIPLAGFNINFTDPNTLIQISSGAVGAFNTLNNTGCIIDTNGKIGADGNSGLMPNTPGLTLTDLVGGDVWIITNVNGELIARDTTLNNKYLSLSNANRLYRIGDIDLANLNTLLSVDDTAAAITVQTGNEFVHRDPAGNKFLQSSVAAGFYKYGDIDGIANNMILNIDDVNRQIQLTTNFGNGTGLIVNDLTGNIEIANGTGTAAIRMNGVTGFTGTVTPVTTITVNGGIVTAVA